MKKIILCLVFTLLLTDLAFSMAPPSQPSNIPSGDGILTTYLPFIVLVTIIYFLIIRPYKKREGFLWNMLYKKQMADKMKCKKCGHHLNDADIVCTACGAEVSSLDKIQ